MVSNRIPSPDLFLPLSGCPSRRRVVHPTDPAQPRPGTSLEFPAVSVVSQAVTGCEGTRRGLAGVFVENAGQAAGRPRP